MTFKKDEAKEALENLTVEQVQDNLETGVVMAIREQISILDTQIKDLSKKELTRLIKNAARFPAPIPTIGYRELKATRTLYALKDLQIEMAILSLAKQQENKEKEDE